MKQIRALFAIAGIVDKEIDELAEKLAGYDMVLTGEIRTNRASLISSLGTGRCDLLVLSEYFGEGRIESGDIDRMTMAASAGLNIIMVVDDDAEVDYLRRMIDKGVYNLIFQNDADIDGIAERIVNPLSRKEALSYCRIEPDASGSLPETEDSCDAEMVRYILQGSGDALALEERIGQVNRRLNDSLKLLGVLEELPMDVLETISRIGGYKYIADVAIATKKKRMRSGSAAEKKDASKSIRLPVKEKDAAIKIDDVKPREIAFVSTNVGVGCTYLSIMCANAFAKEGKKTAIVELDDQDENFKTLCALVRKDSRGVRCFSIGGVDYYYGISLSQFIKEYKGMYDVSVYDSGCCPADSIKALCGIDGIRIFVAAGAGEYKAGELGDFVSEALPLDKDSAFTYFITPSEDEDIAYALKAAPHSDVWAVGYEASPFNPSKKTSRVFLKAADGIRNDNRKVKEKDISDRMNERPREHMTKLAAGILIASAIAVFGFAVMHMAQMDKSRKALEKAYAHAAVQDETIAGYTKEIEELKEKEKGTERDVCILLKPAIIGTKVTEDMVTKKIIHSDMPQNVYAGMDEIVGKYAACNITAGVPLYHYFVADPAKALPVLVEEGPDSEEAGMDAFFGGPEGG